MEPAPSDPRPDRRSQRRRAFIGWIGGFLALAAFALVLVAAAARESHERHAFRVPYGEMMTSQEYGEINEGEEDATVLTRLDASGRPERLTKPYVLVLFPKREAGEYCTYWEFSDELEIFARLCFDESTGDLVQKLKGNALHPRQGFGGGQGTVV
jgi:hypothetical protein